MKQPERRRAAAALPISWLILISFTKVNLLCQAKENENVVSHSVFTFIWFNRASVHGWVGCFSSVCSGS